MSSIFIAYDSSDKGFAIRLKEALEVLGYKVWIDFQSLNPSEYWVDEISKAIKGSIAFIYLISNKSIRKDSYCTIEFNDAKQWGKKIIPILLPRMNEKKIPKDIGVYKIHWQKWDAFGDAPFDVSSLDKVIRTKFEWSEFHAKLTIDSDKWDKAGRKRIEYPLSKKEIQNAQRMFLTIKEKEYPKPTQPMRDYVLANEKRLTWQRIIATFASVSILTIICIAAVITIYQSWVAQQAVSSVQPLQAAKSAAEATARAEQQRAEQEERIARAGQLADQADALTEQNPIVSFLLSVEAYNMFGNAQTYGVLRKNARAYPQVMRFITGANYFESGRVTTDGQSFGPGDRISAATFSPDGKMIAFAVRDTIILQDVGSGEELQVFTLPPRDSAGGDNYVSRIVFSPDSKTIVSDSAQGDTIFWDIENGKLIKNKEGHKKDASVGNFAFNSDGQLFIYTSWSENSNKLIVQNLVTGEILCDINIYSSLSLSFIPKTNKLVSNVFTAIPIDDLLDKKQVENNIVIWDLHACTFNIFTFDENIGRIHDVILSSNGNIVAFENVENDVFVWDLSLDQILLNLSGTDHPNPTNMALSSAGNRLAVGYGDGRISIWDIETKELDYELKLGTDRVGLLAFSTNGDILLSNNILWDLSRSQSSDFILTGHAEGVYGIAFSPDGNLLASAGQDTKVIVWDVVAKQSLCVLEGHQTAVRDVYFISDNTIVSIDMGSGTIDSVTLTWNLSSRCPNIPAGRVPVDKAEASDFYLFLERRSNGLWIVNESGETIGNPLMGLPASATRIVVYLFDRSNSFLATGGNDGSIMLWDVANTRLISALFGHSDVVRALGFSPDNKILASGSSDGTIRLWDINLNSWLQKLCQSAGRNFTLEEWRLYFPGEDYRITCPQWRKGE